MNFFFRDLILSFHFYFHSCYGSSVFIFLLCASNIDRGVLGVWMISHYIRYKKGEEIRVTTISNTLSHIVVPLPFITGSFSLVTSSPDTESDTETIPSQRLQPCLQSHSLIAINTFVSLSSVTSHWLPPSLFSADRNLTRTSTLRHFQSAFSRARLASVSALA